MAVAEWKPAKLDELGFVGRGKSRHRPPAPQHSRSLVGSERNKLPKRISGPRERKDAHPDEITGDHLVEYSHAAPPVTIGHYWMEGQPMPLANNIACLDYSVAKRGGRLTAYRWDGEQVLKNERFGFY